MKRLIKKADESLFERHLLDDDEGITNPKSPAEQEADEALEEIDPATWPGEGYNQRRYEAPDE